MSYTIEFVDQTSQSEMLTFLKQHENYALFLLGNFEDYGLKLTEAPYSGNFKLIRQLGEVVGVFCLTKTGSLLIEATVYEPIFDDILGSCLQEQIPMTGLIGSWAICHPFWEFLKGKKVIQQEVFASKEILYSIDLSQVSYLEQPAVRLLTSIDFRQWKVLNADYLEEEGIPSDLSDEDLLRLFLEKVEKRIMWGYFLEERLVSVAELNAKALDLGQVGGVYTAPAFRQRGYAKSVMQQLLVDCQRLHGMRKVIIFTGDKNVHAQKLYLSLGVKPMGYFALLFGK